MEAIREYVIGVTAAALLCAGAVKLIPGGSVGAVVKSVSGLLMVLALLRPVVELELSELEILTDGIGESAQQYVEDGQQQAQEALREGITGQVRAYILDKARELETELTVEVELTQEPLPVPERVILQGRISPYAKSVLTEYLEKELGIGAEDQIWIS